MCSVSIVLRAIGLDADLCAAAFRAALSAKYADKALGIWDRAMERDIRLPDNIYSIAVSGFISCGQISDALHFKNRLEKRGGKLDLFAYNAIIEVGWKIIRPSCTQICSSGETEAVG